MAYPLPQPVTDLISITEGVAVLKPTGHPITYDQLDYLLTREEGVRGHKVVVRVRGKRYVSASDIFRIHRDWVARTA